MSQAVSRRAQFGAGLVALALVAFGAAGPQLEVVVAGIAVLGVAAWLPHLSLGPRWLNALGALGIMGWVALMPVWMIPVRSDYGSCGSVLIRQHAAGDLDGVCDFLTADQYNSTLPMFLASSSLLIAVGVVSLLLDRAVGVNPGTPNDPKLSVS